LHLFSIQSLSHRISQYAVVRSTHSPCVPSASRTRKCNPGDLVFCGWYLENYQGYVELAEGLYRARENGEVPPGSVEEREWREKLRRAKDGVARTTSRLNTLEEHNPELASDNRISQRAGVARMHAELERRSGAV
jgi:hypothetical protein